MNDEEQAQHYADLEERKRRRREQCALFLTYMKDEQEKKHAKAPAQENQRRQKCALFFDRFDRLCKAILQSILALCFLSAIVIFVGWLVVTVLSLIAIFGLLIVVTVLSLIAISTLFKIYGRRLCDKINT